MDNTSDLNTGVFAPAAGRTALGLSGSTTPAHQKVGKKCTAEKEENKMSDKPNDLERALWLLSEIACAEPDDIESNEIEVYGEDEYGREGFCSFKITDIAQQAIEVIEALKKERK